MFKSIIITVVLSTSISLAGGHSVGNGGDGILIDGTIYTYDLVENGLHTKPFFDQSIEVPDFINTAVNTQLYAFDAKVRRLVSIKLSEIYKIDPAFYRVLETVLNMYQWNILSNFSLVEINDEDGSDVDIPKELFRQVAVRSVRSIKMDGNLIQQMNAENITAMIFHEIVYAITPIRMILANGSYIGHQSSQEARIANAYLFNPTFSQKGIAGLRKAFDRRIPVGHGTPIQYATTETGFIYKNLVTVENQFFTLMESQKFETFKLERCQDNNVKKGLSLEVPNIEVTENFKTYQGMMDGGLKTFWFVEINWWAQKKPFSYSPVYDFSGNFIIQNKSKTECLKTFDSAWKYLTETNF